MRRPSCLFGARSARGVTALVRCESTRLAEERQHEASVEERVEGFGHLRLDSTTARPTPTLSVAAARCQRAAAALPPNDMRRTCGRNLKLYCTVYYSEVCIVLVCGCEKIGTERQRKEVKKTAEFELAIAKAKQLIKWARRATPSDCLQPQL